MGIPSLPGVSGSDRLASDWANAVVSGTIAAVGPGKAFAVWGPMNLVAYGSRATSLAVTAGSTTATPGATTGLAVGDAISSTVCPPGTTIGSAPGGGTFTMTFAPQGWSGTPVSGRATIQMGVVGGLLPNGKSLSSLVGATILNSPYFASGTTIVSAGVDGTSLVASAAATSSPDLVKGVPPIIWFAPTGNCITAAGTDTAAVFTGSGSGYQVSALTAQLERSFDGGSTWLACNIGFGAVATIDKANLPTSIAFGDPEASMLYRLNALAFTAGATPPTVNYRISTTGQASTSISLQTI